MLARKREVQLLPASSPASGKGRFLFSNDLPLVKGASSFQMTRFALKNLEGAAVRPQENLGKRTPPLSLMTPTWGSTCEDSIHILTIYNVYKNTYIHTCVSVHICAVCADEHVMQVCVGVIA